MDFNTWIVCLDHVIQKYLSAYMTLLLSSSNAVDACQEPLLEYRILERFSYIWNVLQNMQLKDGSCHFYT